eukprot:scaffold62137_cov15-Prasinocladus_malaysianus.AAC.1
MLLLMLLFRLALPLPQLTSRRQVGRASELFIRDQIKGSIGRLATGVMRLTGAASSGRMDVFRDSLVLASRGNHPMRRPNALMVPRLPRPTWYEIVHCIVSNVRMMPQLRHSKANGPSHDLQEKCN